MRDWTEIYTVCLWDSSAFKVKLFTLTKHKKQNIRICFVAITAEMYYIKYNGVMAPTLWSLMCTVKYSTVQYIIVQYSTVHYSTVQYIIIQ